MQFVTNPDGTLSVQGNVKYYTTPSGCRYVCPKTYYNFVGTWDALGNLISQTVGSLPSQPVLYVNGNEQVYAQAIAPTGASTTGFDSRGYGYVDIPASHYTWQTPNNQFVTIPDQQHIFQVALNSDGDFPLNLEGSSVRAAARGYYNQTSGTATIISTTDPNDCANVMAAQSAAGTPGIPVGTSCSFTILYDPNSPTTMKTSSPYGLAYVDLTLKITTDAGNLSAWGASLTITGAPAPED